MQKPSKTETEDRGRKDSLTDLIRTGAQPLWAQALNAEVAALLASYADQRDEQGHARVVLSGHHPKRDIQTGIGPVTVQVPKVRSRQEGHTGHVSFGAGSPVCAQGGQLRSNHPLALFERYLNRGDAAGPGSPRGPRGQRLSASTVARLKQAWREEYDI